MKFDWCFESLSITSVFDLSGILFTYGNDINVTEYDSEFVTGASACRGFFFIILPVFVFERLALAFVRI